MRLLYVQCKIWRNFLQVMAAAAGCFLFLVLFLAQSPVVVRVSSGPIVTADSPAGSPDARWEISRQNRALQFTDAQELDAADSGAVSPSFFVPAKNANAENSQSIYVQSEDRELLLTRMDISHEVYKAENSKTQRFREGVQGLNRHAKNNGPHQIPITNQETHLQIKEILETPHESLDVNSISGNDIITNKKDSSPDLTFSTAPERKLASRQSDTSHRTPLPRNSTEKPVKRLPKVIIIGAKKAGTRALLEFLRIHPNIESPGPEPHFFDRNYHKGIDWYRELMPKSYQDQLTIEKTPAYFVSRDVPMRIFDLDPDMKLLLVTRDPVTRAISDYCQAASKHPVRPFEQHAALNVSRDGRNDAIKVNTNWSAIKIGLYAQHLESWLRVFPMRQMHVVDGGRLVEQPAAEVALVEEFLGLPSFIKDSHFRLRGFKETFPCLVREDGRLHCLDHRSKGRRHPQVREDVLKTLRDFYRPFNQQFYRMVGRTFDWQ